MKENSEEEVSLKTLVIRLKEWVHYLRSKLIIIVVVGILGGVLGYMYAYVQKVSYTATVTFALEEDKGASGGLSGLASQFGYDLDNGAGGAFSGGNLIELMRSRNIIEKTLMSHVNVNGRDLSLAEFYIEINHLNEGWSANSRMKNLSFSSPLKADQNSLERDSIIGIIYASIVGNNLNISQRDKKSSITSVDVKSQNEIFSKVFVESLIKEVSSFYIETKSKKAKRNVEILERETDSIRAELNAAISGVAIANDVTFNLNPAFNVKRVQSSKRQIDVQANTAILTELVKNLELAKVTLLKETPLIQIIDHPILPLAKERKSRLKTMLAMGFLAGFLAVLILVLRRWLRKLAIV